MGGNKKLIVGNWKMHFTVKEAVAYAQKLSEIKVDKQVEVIVAPHNLALAPVAGVLAGSDIKVAGQNAYWKDEGSYTGEVGMPMLRGLAEYVLIGHSERRHIFGENDDVIMHKVRSAMRANLKPILCVGETLLEKTQRQTSQVLHHQITLGLSQLTASEVEKMVIAYEPVWAISNGKNFAHHEVATPEDVDSAQKTIRHNIAELYGRKAADKVKILYGASVAADLVSGFLSIKGINGLLAGGASLSLHDFKPIIEKTTEFCEKNNKKENK